MSTPAFPWHDKQWRFLRGAHERQRLGHAILFSGRPGAGTDGLALRFAEYLLCHADPPLPRPCGECRGCTLLKGGAHPDFRLIEPPEEGKTVTVDQVRELTAYYALTAQYDRGKLALIRPADGMNVQAANALLKILEEPPAGAVMLLAADNISALPMTIRSRCTRVRCESVDVTAARQWLLQELPDEDDAGVQHLLAHAGGAPLLARRLAGEHYREFEQPLLDAIDGLRRGTMHPVQAADRFAALSPARLMQLARVTVTRLVYAKFGASPPFEDAADGPDRRLHDLADDLNLNGLYAFLDLVGESSVLHGRNAGLRETDILDTLWMGLAQAARGRVG